MTPRAMTLRRSLGTGCLIFAIALAAGAGPAQAKDTNAASVRIENFVGRIVLETRPGPLRYTLEEGRAGAFAPAVSLEGAHLTVAGKAHPHGLSCRARLGQISIKHADRWVSASDLPVLKVEAPVGTRLVLSGGSVFGEVGNLGPSSLTVEGCGALRLGALGPGSTLTVSGSGEVTAGNVGGQARIGLLGSGDLRIGDVDGPARIRLAGSGDLVVGDVAGPLVVEMSGSGDVDVEAAGQALDVRSSGSGDVKVRRGNVETAKISISGSADVYFGGVAGTAHLTSSGSGDIAVRTVAGQVAKKRIGSGDIRVGQ